MKAWCKMDISTPPSLGLTCPQAKAKIDNHDHMFRDRGVDKTKYGHEDIIILIRTTIYCHIIPYATVIIQSQFQVWIINFIKNLQTMIPVIAAIAIYHNSRKSLCKSFYWASSHTQSSCSLSKLLTLMQYLWSKLQ